MNPLADFVAVIPAGGAGKRLWPLSRAAQPKFLLDLTGVGRTLIQQAWDRLEPLAGANRVEVVTGAAHAAAVAAQLPGLDHSTAAASTNEPSLVSQGLAAPESDQRGDSSCRPSNGASRLGHRDNLLIEPGPKDSMPAIALAAAIAQRRYGDVVVGSFAADHIIDDQRAFAQAVEAAYLAALEGFIATIGVKPTDPTTAYGYIKAGPSLGLVQAPQIKRVAAFKEKPDRATAERYLADSDYRWNAGMFVFRASLVAEQLRRLRPGLADGIGRMADAWDTDQREAVAAAVWPGLERIAFDYAIAEPVAAEGGLATVPGDFGWSDLGDFASLADLTAPDADGVTRLAQGSGPAPVALDSDGAVMVTADGRLVALLGLPDAVVVDTPTAVLVSSRDRLQDVKALVEHLEKSGLRDYL
ncbi:MAG: mannose-1-phosphate guanylyltransferase [Bifidobacteriaceae bacterium]|jgi:mannose-1-phosphate guanylyltransferase|nr:mannose-1-phosphate guanylyltransferase [Bifidobacteriaceae bacterium]